MQYLIISPLGESFESSSVHMNDLGKEIEKKLGYKVSQQHLTVDPSNTLRRRNSPSEVHSTTSEAPITTVNEEAERPVIITVNPTWYPSFLEAYVSLMRSVVELILAKSERRFEHVKKWSNVLANCNPYMKKLFSQLVIPFISNLLLVLFGACLMGVCAQISIVLPASISTVPITGQTFGVLWLGSLAGFVIAPLSVLLYLFCGAVVQIPWFSNQASGSQVLFQSASSGFLIGFVFSALVCGWFCSRMASDRTIMMNLLMLCLSDGVTFVFGCGWLAFGLPNLGLAKGIEKGLVPFLVGETIKIVLVLVMVRLSWLVLFKIRHRVLTILKAIGNNSSSATLVDLVRVEEGNILSQQVETSSNITNNQDNRCVSTCSDVTSTMLEVEI